MDLSSLTESQQQQLQQLQTQYQEHQQQRQDEAAAAAAEQQQQQYEQSQSYYQPQPQSYDQSYYSYYHNQNLQQSQQYAAYYNNPDYANVYHSQEQQYSQAETVPVAYHPPAAPPPEAQVGQGGDQSNSGYSVPNGVNAAAAQATMAALSQSTQRGAMGGYGPPMGPGQFMGPMHHGPPVGQSPYRGGGRRGGSPFRGGRGNFTGGSGPPFLRRGRGRGRGGRSHPPHGTSSSSLPEGSNNEAFQSDTGNQQPIRIAWCELCRVDCTSFEILEQHKNGKRHKKNLEKLGETKTSYKQPTNEAEDGGKITTDAPDNVKQGEGENPENFTTEDQNQVENERLGMKRKMRGGRGGKRLKTFGGPSRRSLGPNKPKPVVLICDLCNVKCDTQEVFDRHVSGKKHISKVKRFEGHQAMYGPTEVQALYPPNPMAQVLSRSQVPQEAFLGAPQGSYPLPQVQNPNPQLSDAPLEFSNQNNVAQVQQPSASVEPETKKVASE